MLHTLVIDRFDLIDTVVIPLLKPFLDARQQRVIPWQWSEGFREVAAYFRIIGGS